MVQQRLDTSVIYVLWFDTTSTLENVRFRPSKPNDGKDRC